MKLASDKQIRGHEVGLNQVEDVVLSQLYIYIYSEQMFCLNIQ